MGKKVWIWVDNDEGNAYAESSQAADDTSNPRCPKCGEKSVYDEGQIDQDFMGNDIYGWWFSCYNCNLSTQAIEGVYDDGE